MFNSGKTKEWFNVRFIGQAKDDFDVTDIRSGSFKQWVDTCAETYRGNPCWINIDDDIDSVNFAKAICSEVARLATMGIECTFDGAERSAWINQQFKRVCERIRHWAEYGCAYGTIILKPDNGGVTMFTPDSFIATETRYGEIVGGVFYDCFADAKSEKYYSRLEYHRFVDDVYVVTNRCYVGRSAGEMTRPIDISLTPWRNLAEEVYIKNLSRPLFGVFRMPQANNIDVDSPLGMPIFTDAMQELRDLDIAYSRNAKEIKNSKRIVLLDSNAMLPCGGGTEINALTMRRQREAMELPDMVRNVQGDGAERFYQEINPELNTDIRTSGINALLSQIGFKMGFSNGHFVFNESTGIQTATQVEAEQQRTVQMVQDVREKLMECLVGLAHSLNAFADLYTNLPAEAQYTSDRIEDTVGAAVHLSDIVYSFEEDRAHHYSMALQGKYPWEEYYVKYLKCSREEARQLLAMAKEEQAAPRLFGYEE